MTFTSCMDMPILKQNNDPLRFIDFGVVTTDSLGAIQIKPLYKDKDVYQLLSDAILPQGKLSNLEKLKLINLTTADIRSKIEFQLTLYCDVQDSIDFFANLDTKTYCFDCSLLPNTVCFSSADIAQLFALYDEKGWANFRNKYGNYGLHYFSIPLFNSDRTKAIIIYGGMGSTKTGSTELLLLEKARSKWTIYRTVTLGII